VLLLVIALLFFNWLVPQPPGWISQASSKPLLDDIGQRLMAALPEDAEATILKRLRRDDDTGATTDQPPAAEEEAPAGTANYGSGARLGLDSLIENSGSGQQ
jgi:membrane protein required for colicin V production